MAKLSVFDFQLAFARALGLDPSEQMITGITVELNAECRPTVTVRMLLPDETQGVIESLKGYKLVPEEAD